ncbi:MAG: FHA domain-containing protein [Candidatus Latescibacteria bacterium]|nr:FHA domain-containing protein [Candidatus Latescibacterota bacterium]
MTSILLQTSDGTPAFGPFDPTVTRELLLGRDAGCAVVLAERSVSRQHARLRWDGAQWLLSDLGSRFGSTVNGAAVEGERAVAPGDRIALGTVELTVAAAEAPAPAAPDDRRYRVLLDILELMSGGRSLDELLGAVIRLAGEAVGADRGFVLLYDAESARWRPDALAAWRAAGLDESSPSLDSDAIGQVSQTVLREALDSRRAVSLDVAASDARFERAESLVAQHVQSVVCAPLLLAGEGRALGALYVDRRHAGAGPFAAADRELLVTVAAQAARVIEKEQLEAARARAEKLALLGTMVGRIAHELKNPLYNVRGTAENLLARLDAGEVPDDLKQRVERVLAGVDRAETRMQSLLRFARPGGGARTPVDLARVLTAAAVDCAPRFQEAGVELLRDYPRGLRVNADAEALEQVFSNLLVNAAQALAAAERGGRVWIAAETQCRLESTPDWVEVRVEDDGPGIAAADLPRLFEDFFTTRAGRGGSGLGLAICRHLVAEHRGSLSAANRAEGGARFTVGLPLLAAD